MFLAGLSTVAAIGIIPFIPPTYLSQACLWETEKLRMPESGGFTEDPQSYYATQTELLKSERLANAAYVRLQTSPTNSVPVDRSGKPLAVRLRVSQVPKTTLFEVEASSSVPWFTQAYLGALLDEYLKYRRDVRKAVSGGTMASISDQLLRLERELKADQNALLAFEQANNLAVLEEDRKVASGVLAKLETELSELKPESQILEATTIAQAQSDKTNGGRMAFTTVRNVDNAASYAVATERQAAFKELAALRLKREKLSKYFRPRHPKIVKLDGEIEQAEKLAQIYRDQNRDQLSAVSQAIKMRVESTRAAILEWQNKVVAANQRIAEADRLKSNVSRTQSLYDRLQILVQNVDVTRNLDQQTLAVLEPPSEVRRTYKMELALLGLAIFCGLSVGTGIVYVVGSRDDRFRSASDVTEQFGDTILGRVPEVRALRKKGRSPLLANGDEPYAFAEAYRSLRSSLLFLPVAGERPRVILITSATAQEGKSTIAANLAKALALGSSRVLLVDGDCRKGRLHDQLGLHRSPGLTDLLNDTAEPEIAVQKDALPNLSFVSRGTSHRSPGDLLLRPKMDHLLARWRQEFDFVVIDSCPVLSADDATTLAAKTDGTLFVMRRRFSRAAIASEALNSLLERQARVLGIVFNRVDASAKSYVYYKDPDYHDSAINL